MKRIALILIIGLLSFQVKAQDPQLFENDWYLHKLVIDGEDIYPPINSEVPYVLLLFIQDNPNTYVWTYVCDFISGFISVIDNNSFEVIDYFGGLTDCNIYENLVFRGIYFDDFFKYHYIPTIFQYQIQNGTNDDLVLTLTNVDGDLAIYGNVLLANEEFLSSLFIISPNPVQDLLSIDNTSNTEITSIKLYDVLGRHIMTVQEGYEQIDVTHLNSGVLFVEIGTEEGVLIRKIIKE